MDGLSARRQVAWAAAETIVGIGTASLLVALLDNVAPVTGLTVIYLPVVLLVAIRRGQVPGLVAAVLAVLTMNFLFIEPRYHLTISESEHVVALAVFLIAAVVVGRLAADARERAAEAQARAEVADAREREATLLAEAASSMLAGGRLESEVAAIGQGLSALVRGRARVGLTPAPKPDQGEQVLRLPLSSQPGWLYLGEGSDRAVAERILDPLSRLIDVALERRRLAEQAAQSEATRRADTAKTAVLHAVSHDLRSPLTAILTAGSALRGDGLSAGDRDELLSVLDSESHRLARLVEDLLDLSRIEAGALAPRRDWCDLRDVIARAADQVHAAQGEHPIEIELPDELPLVRADNVQMERVFFNLIENAVKFSPDGVPVAISGGAGRGGVTVRVKDQGPGIPSGRRQEVFEPFFRGRGGDAGSGLGLAICQGFVQANGGRITLQSRKGEGTAFAVTLRLTESVPAPA